MLRSSGENLPVSSRDTNVQRPPGIMCNSNTCSVRLSSTIYLTWSLSRTCVITLYCPRSPSLLASAILIHVGLSSRNRFFCSESPRWFEWSSSSPGHEKRRPVCRSCSWQRVWLGTWPCEPQELVSCKKVDSDYACQFHQRVQSTMLMSVLGRAVHICHAISKFYHGTWPAWCGRKIWHNQSNSHSVDSEHLPSNIFHWSFICGTLVGSLWSCMGAWYASWVWSARPLIWMNSRCST